LPRLLPRCSTRRICALAFHQSSFYGVSAVVARYFAAILDDPRAAEALGGTSSLRVQLIDRLGWFADDAAWGEHDRPDLDYPELEAFRAIRPELYAAVARYLDSPDAATREAARAARIPLLKAPASSAERRDATEELRQLLATSTCRHERAATILAIGVAWRQDTTDYLADPDPAIRALAALAPACADNPDATRVILDALTDPVAVDGWFARPLPEIPHRYVPGMLFNAVAERTSSIGELLPAALAVLPHLKGHVQFDGFDGVSRLLSLVFPDGVPESDDELTGDQEVFITALAASSLEVFAPLRDDLARLEPHDVA
jgi:hypothetical protein